MFYIFIRDKLISCDSFLPVAMEMKEKTGRDTHFITFKSKTYNQISQNTVLFDSINQTGKLRYINIDIKNPFNLIKFLIFNLEVLLNSWVNRALIFHFGHINVERKLSLFKWFLPGKRMFFCEANSSGYSAFMWKVDYCERGHIHTIDHVPEPKKGNLFGFSYEWPWIDEKRTAHLDRYIVCNPRAREVWQTHIRKIAPQYFTKEEMKGKNLTLFLGSFGKFDFIETDQSVLNCFRDVLDIIEKNHSDYTLYLKPHVITDMDVVQEELDKRNIKYKISYFHPSLLAFISDAVIANFYTTAQYDGTVFGKPTIEYAEYSEKAYIASEGGSMRPDHISHFIQNDIKKLETTLREVLRPDFKLEEKFKVKTNNTEFFTAIQNL